MAEAAGLTELNTLQKKQYLLRAKLNNIESFAKQFKVSGNLHEIRNRINEMPKIKDNYEALCTEIILLIANNEGEGASTTQTDEAELKEMEAFEKLYYSLLSALQLILDKVSPPDPPLLQSPIDTSQSITQIPNNVRLPVISLPEFGGAYKDWLPFFDAFNSLIHQNGTLDNCQKFHYLKSCLRGEAFRAIDSLTISNLNYTSAWSLLQKRYKNERLIVQSHVQAILNSPEIAKCSADSLRKLVDDVTSNVEALKVLEIPVDSNDAFIVTIVVGKLDYETRKEFENTLDARLPTRRELIEFLEKKCTILDSMNQNIKPKSQTLPLIKKSVQLNRASHVVTTKFTCYFCKQRHFINRCDKFLALSIHERRNEVKQRNLCYNCLRNNHATSDCRASGCMMCQSKTHHTLLHDRSRDQESSKFQTVVSAQIPSTSKESTSEVNSKHGSANYCSQQEPNVILSTAIVLVQDSLQNYQECRSLLDVGSQLNLMSESMCKKLNLTTRRAKICVWGVNQTVSKITKTAEITVRSVHYPHEFTVNCYITENVTVNIPIKSFDKTQLNIPFNCNLADPNFNINSRIDLILSAEVFWGILGTDRINLIHPNLYLTETLLGWVIGGAVPGSEKNLNDRACNLHVKNKQIELSELMEGFWRQEELNEPTNTWTNEEIDCENHFINTFQRNREDGRFIVCLPFKNNAANVGESRTAALRRFISLEKRFRRDSDFQKCYSRAFNENLNLGIIKEIPEEDIDSKDTFYLPHSGVTKKSDKPDKIRIVYDGSAKSSNGKSLNDNLMTGPNLQNELFDILARFRTQNIVISCDIERMFLQIKVNKVHTNYQRLFWRNSDTDVIKEYELTRLVFGLTNSPYTAMRCIRQLALEAAEELPMASYVLTNEIFMDDILCGANNREEAIQLRDQITLILNRGCFKLSKWTSNDPKVIPESSFSSNQPVMLNFENAEMTKILGLWWNPKDDTLNYRVESPDIPETITKRTMLSSIAKLYDPIGIISPIIVKAKILMQSLWSLNLEWDQIVPDDVKSVWVKFVRELDILNDLKVQRKVISDSTPSEIELLAFCDASLRAYGAMIYVRSQNKNGTYCINLICSKSRVSPIKVVSLPRLELCAALLAARLMKRISDALNMRTSKKYFFSDSAVVLHYINGKANSWQTFVANRVAEIQTLSKITDWYHVNTTQNPADLISRGLYPKQIMGSKLYWHGPEFLSKDIYEWTNLQIIPTLDESEVPEKRKLVLTVSFNPEIPVLTKFSSFMKLQRVVAYVLRFVNNVKGNAKPHNFLTIKELTESHNIIIKTIQNREFHDEFSALIKHQSVSKQSRLKGLDPFIDNDGMIRVGGRLREASLPFNKKHPLILPSHHVTRLLIRQEHVLLLHAGPTQTLASFRGKYWPLRGKDEVRKIIHSCLKCFRTSPKLMYQKMGDLPKDRLEPCRPFLKIGLDYFGPLYLKQSKRSTSKIKAWAALFVCMVTRAIHLEVVGDLTSESFINSLKRLIARRGKISQKYCDNATTFVGAKAELREIEKFLCNDQTQADIHPYLAAEGISWKFIPPRSPTFGGLWERLVRSTKQHMKKVTVNALLTFEEASTLLTQIEAVINSRPLTTLSNDPFDFEVLTPSHFLIGESLMDLPEYDFKVVPDNRLNRWQRIQKLKQQFWNRFSKEVLVQLQHRQKWHRSSPIDLKIGTLVLIADDTPPLVWKMGRVIELFPGHDGTVRVATVRTNQGTYKRSIRKLAIVPTEEADSCYQVRE